MTAPTERPATGCTHWDGAAGAYCAAGETRPYIVGPRCEQHRPTTAPTRGT